MTAVEEARSHFEAGAFGRAHEAAIGGLDGAPDDVELLRLAGRAGVEVGSDDAVDRLRKVTELQPESAEAWRDLADALAAEGRTEEASEAFRKVLEIEPEDEVALTALGHTAFQEGKRDDAVSMLEQVAGRAAGASTAAISLVDMYRTLGQPDRGAGRGAQGRRGGPRQPARRARRGRAGARDRATSTRRPTPSRACGSSSSSPTARSRRCRARSRWSWRAGSPSGLSSLARQASAIDSVGRTAGVLAHLEAELGADETPDDAIARGATTVFIQAQEVPPSRHRGGLAARRHARGPAPRDCSARPVAGEAEARG